MKRLSSSVARVACPVLVWGLAAGCASVPRTPHDPFMTMEPGLAAPQQRMRPAVPAPIAQPAPGANGPAPYQRTPPSRPAPRPSYTPQSPTPITPRSAPPKTFAEPETSNGKSSSPAPLYKTEKRPAPMDSSPEPITPSDGPTLGPPEAIAPTTRPVTATADRDESVELDIVVQSPRPVGSGAPFQLTLRNSGDVTLRNVAIISEFDEALQYPGVSRQAVTHKIPKIEFGDIKESRLTLIGREPGTHTCRFTVNVGSQELLTKNAVVEFIPRQLDWQIHGPRERTVGSRAEFNLPLINVSPHTLKNVTVRVEHDGALRVREMTRGGKLDDRSVTWQIDELAADEGLLLQLELECQEPTTFACLAATISGPDLPTDDAEACLAVTPLNGRLDLRVQDIADPVAVGGVAEFRVTVENPGLAAAKNVALECQVPEGFELASVLQLRNGKPVAIKLDDGKTFPTVARLDPDRKLEYLVKLTARRAGPHEIQFTVRDAGHDAPHEVIEPVMVHR